MPSFVKCGPGNLDKKSEMWKVYKKPDSRTNGWTTDKRFSEKLTWTFGSGELKRKSCWFFSYNLLCIFIKFCSEMTNGFSLSRNNVRWHAEYCKLIFLIPVLENVPCITLKMDLKMIIYIFPFLQKKRFKIEVYK